MTGACARAAAPWTLLAEFAQRAHFGFDRLEAVTVAGGDGLARLKKIALHDGHAGAVERVDADDGQVEGFGKRGAEGGGDVVQGVVAHRAALSRRSFMGMRRTPGGPRMPSSRTATAIGVVMPGPYSKGVQTVSKSSGSITSR